MIVMISILYIIVSQAFTNPWDCHIHTAGRTGYVPQFPFFMKISSHICDMVEQSIAEINKSDDILQERGSSEAVGMIVITQITQIIDISLLVAY